MALGGRAGDVRRMVVGEGLWISIGGLAVGVVVSLACSRLLEGLLFGVGTTDPLTYGAIVVVLLLVALVASFGPARRATRIDPVVALRD